MCVCVWHYSFVQSNLSVICWVKFHNPFNAIFVSEHAGVCTPREEVMLPVSRITWRSDFQDGCVSRFLAVQLIPFQ